jgi:predicted NAD/FAD-binding protein
MSMSVSCRGCGLEYAGGRGAAGLFAHRSSAANPRFLSMLAQVPAFHRRARALLRKGSTQRQPTLGEFLAEGQYSRYFVRHFANPLVSAVWSCGPHRVADYPARYLFEFLANHGMLSLKGSAAWKTVVGGSRSYVDKLAKRLTAVRVFTPVRAVVRHADGVVVQDDSGSAETFDEVVVATHPDQALRLLAQPTAQERAVLGAFEYSENETLLHTDAGLLPAAGAARASWNYLLPQCAPEPGGVRVSYHLNTLQRLRSDTDFVVTLGRTDEVEPARVLARMSYRHPIYTPEALEAQRRLPILSTGRIAFAGAYHGWGFHEDGCLSGVRAAQSLGVPW